MCGRLSQTTAAEKAIKIMRILGDVPLIPARYNIAPSQPLMAVRQMNPGVNEWALLQWGLIPSWAKEKKTGYSLFNARAETVSEKPAYRAAYRYRRCIIPADHFFEWKEIPGQKRKQPYEIGFKTDEPMFLAGLWEHWEGDTEVIESCSIITTEANQIMTALHDRMPVIIRYDDAGAWLDAKQNDVKTLQQFLTPYQDEAEMRIQPIEPDLLAVRRKKANSTTQGDDEGNGEH